MGLTLTAVLLATGVINEELLLLATFVLFIAGAFLGMFVSDKLGDRAFRVMGIAAGTVVALAITAGLGLLLLR